MVLLTGTVGTACWHCLLVLLLPLALLALLLALLVPLLALLLALLVLLLALLVLLLALLVFLAPVPETGARGSRREREEPPLPVWLLSQAECTVYLELEL